MPVVVLARLDAEAHGEAEAQEELDGQEDADEDAGDEDRPRAHVSELLGIQHAVAQPVQPLPDQDGCAGDRSEVGDDANREGEADEDELDRREIRNDALRHGRYLLLNPSLIITLL